MTTEAPAGMRIGHVHLKVSDLDRSIDFYQRVLGLKLMQRYGPSAAFLSAGGYHHHLGLNTWDSKGAGPAPRGYPGLFHTAFLFPDRKTLGEALARAIAAGIEISGAADHGVSEAVYFDDPDGMRGEDPRDELTPFEDVQCHEWGHYDEAHYQEEDCPIIDLDGNEVRQRPAHTDEIQKLKEEYDAKIEGVEKGYKGALHALDQELEVLGNRKKRLRKTKYFDNFTLGLSTFEDGHGVSN